MRLTGVRGPLAVRPAGTWERNGRPWAGIAVSYALGAVLFAAYAVSRRQDANWDLQNYHDYDAYALLHWRYPLDAVPGGAQTYLNPLPYLLPYLLRHHLPPAAAAVVLAMMQALVIPLAWALSGFLVEGQDRRALGVRALATLTAATGAITLSEVGTSFADLLLAVPGLGALLAVLAASAETDGRRADRLHLLAGALAGIAMGLKLTNGVVVIALLGAVLLPVRSWMRSARAAALVAFGAGAGCVLGGGWWAFYLWRSFGSPTFPFLNTVFRSPSAALVDLTDSRFLPHGAGDALTYPFRIAAGLHPTAENAFQDPRFLVALPLCAAFALVTLHAIARRRPVQQSRVALLQASVFLIAGVVVWLFAFAIQRYAITFELLAGLLALAVVAGLVPKRLSLPGCALAAVALLAWTRPADWWHRPWPDAYAPHPPAEVTATPAAYLVNTLPFGYWVRALPRGSRFYGIDPELLASGGPLARRVSAGLDHPPGGKIWALGFDQMMEPKARAGLEALGVALAPPCYRARSFWWVDTIFCRAERVGNRPFAAPDLRVGQSVAFSDRGSGWIYELSGWDLPDAESTWSIGAASVLVLKPESQSRPLALDLDVAGMVGPAWPESDVDVAMPSSAPQRWVFRQGDAGWGVRTICVPGAAKLRDGVLKLAFQPTKPHSPRDAGLGSDKRLLSVAVRRMELRPARPGECED
jgi:hypothetical protein